MMNKKASVSIAVIFLVVATLVLCLTAIFYFSTKQEQRDESIYSSRTLGSLDSRELRINFLIQDLTDRSAKGVFTTHEFIKNAKNNLGLYKNSNGEYFIEELGQIESQLIEDNVGIGNGLITFKTNIVLKEEVLNNDNKKEISTIYDYVKIFESKV